MMRDVVLITVRDGWATLTQPQAAALAHDGHLDSDLVSDLDNRAVRAWLERHTDLARCDFCDRLGVTWRFPARDYSLPAEARIIPGHESWSTGAWTACEACGRLVQAGRRDQLARRAAKRLAFPVKHMRSIHDLFWANREGAGERIER